ncbi:non-heme iron oxygenase ferredoxin subunit [Falsarthrobacter nasiphocae]|uniref:3-phenylpropionate/trans-cinnamate dioxygenase ferredoxin subunit n=1 Tax=Falsarthrobacter nasiphocae TaxID=189863 RepID=A0AAE4C763_9MICC|nr:non-heme iron oxygenase ferredoxin subunit [Falsarthrobacter nasiphocae]MDR6891145.1 3-phenylpropionate/trans-cinnamate dioxygenase ferredoxin subunit [Falsarthrobacter nasiphocae]
MAMTPAARLDEIAPGTALRVVVGGTAVALARNSDGSVHALADRCSHDDVSLSEGDVARGRIECWGHGSEFDLETGRPAQLPATEPVAVYPVEIRDDEVLVDTSRTLNGL